MKNKTTGVLPEGQGEISVFPLTLLIMDVHRTQTYNIFCVYGNFNSYFVEISNFD